MLFAIGVLGAVIGSFVNVVSVREGKGEDFVHGRSYCPHCQHSYMHWIYYRFFLISFYVGSVAIVNSRFLYANFLVE